MQGHTFGAIITYIQVEIGCRLRSDIDTRAVKPLITVIAW